MRDRTAQEEWAVASRYDTFAVRYLVTVRIAAIRQLLCNREHLKLALGADQHGQVPVCGQSYLPLGAPRDRAMLTFHGGGFVDNTADSRRNMMAHLATQRGVRFAFEHPEHPLPAQIEWPVAAHAGPQGATCDK